MLFASDPGGEVFREIYALALGSSKLHSIEVLGYFVPKSTIITSGGLNIRGI